MHSTKARSRFVRRVHGGMAEGLTDAQLGAAYDELESEDEPPGNALEAPELETERAELPVVVAWQRTQQIAAKMEVVKAELAKMPH